MQKLIKMKFTVEVEDFWLEEGELSGILQQAVTNDVIYKIKEHIKEKVEKLMEDLLKKEVLKQMETRVSVLMENFLKEGKVKGRYSGDPELTIEEWLSANFKNADQTIKDYIQKSAKTQSDELKKRYDLLFASQIVAKLNEQSMLKEDVAKLLLS